MIPDSLNRILVKKQPKPDPIEPREATLIWRNGEAVRLNHGKVKFVTYIPPIR